MSLICIKFCPFFVKIKASVKNPTAQYCTTFEHACFLYWLYWNCALFFKSKNRLVITQFLSFEIFYFMTYNSGVSSIFHNKRNHSEISAFLAKRLNFHETRNKVRYCNKVHWGWLNSPQNLLFTPHCTSQHIPMPFHHKLAQDPNPAEKNLSIHNQTPSSLLCCLKIHKTLPHAK